MRQHDQGRAEGRAVVVFTDDEISLELPHAVRVLLYFLVRVAVRVEIDVML